MIILNYEKLAEKLKLFGQTKTTNEYGKNEEMMAINEKDNGRSVRDKSDNVTSFGYCLHGRNLGKNNCFARNMGAESLMCVS